MKRANNSLWLIVTTLILASGSPILAGSLNCSVADAQGDALWEATSPSPEVQPYRDIVQIEATKVGRSVFIFAMDMASEVPNSPTFLLPSVAQMFWVWRLDTDPSTAPAGYPETPGISTPFEFVVRVIWDGGSFRGEVIDRRPLLTGGSALVRPAPFKISRATISVSVDSESLGDPGSFRWGAGTVDWLVDQQGNLGGSLLDSVPLTYCPAT